MRLIRIIIRNEDVDEKFAKKHLGLKIGSYVCLKIIDDGKGMDEETKHRIFEPFFTTNFQGRGLGMAAAYGIVKNHDGWIGVDSEPDKGTEVRIYLPAVDVQIKKAEEPKVEISLGSGTILMIEDEDMVIDVGRTMIEKLGYSVLVAKCGKEAINIAKTFSGNIDLVLLDMGLPDIGGKVLYPLLMEVRPKLKVIVCSGYSIDGTIQDVLDAGAQGFIQKPFTFVELYTRIKELVERRRDKRFKVKEGAVVTPKSDPSQKGLVMDINRYGLAFTYIEDKERLGEFSELAVLMVEENFNMDKVPCKTISELELSDYPFFETGIMKRCGIQFGELTPNQTDKLEYFIENHTIAG